MAEQRSWLQRAVYCFSWLLVRWLGRLCWRLRFRGADEFPASGGGLVCSNHQSYLDPVLVGAFCPRRLNYLARETLFDQGFFGALIRFYDAIPVKREGMGISGLKETLRRLRRGELVLIFPEGTRTEDGDVASLKSGFCLLARKAGVPLIPVAISGAYEAWPKGQRLPGMGRICLSAAEPIDVETIASLGDEELVALLEQRMRQGFATSQAVTGHGECAS